MWSFEQPRRLGWFLMPGDVSVLLWSKRDSSESWSYRTKLQPAGGNPLNFCGCCLVALCCNSWGFIT